MSETKKKTKPGRAPTESDYRRLDPKCAGALSEIPIQEIAKIAATLARGDGAEPSVNATARAFELLEIAYYGNFGLKHFNGSYEAGLAHIVESKKLKEAIEAGMAASPKYDFKLDASGKGLPVPFNDGLVAVIPKLGVRKAQEASVRIARFKEWLIDRWQEVKPEQSEQTRLKECEGYITKWKAEGFPATLFAAFLRSYSDWWKQRKSQTNSANASGDPTKGKKKGKQGRVRREDDKRLGARV